MLARNDTIFIALLTIKEKLNKPCIISTFDVYAHMNCKVLLLLQLVFTVPDFPCHASCFTAAIIFELKGQGFES